MRGARGVRLDRTTRPSPYLEKYARDEPRLVPTLNTYGRGPARALRYGIDHAAADVIVVTMADGSDDPQQIDHWRTSSSGASWSPPPRATCTAGSRSAARCSSGCCRAPRACRCTGSPGSARTTRPTRSRPTTREFVREVGIESDAGFELGIEMVAKARRLRLPVAELPTIWLDRTVGQSNFQVATWLPRYLRWYRYAFGPKVTARACVGKMNKVR